MSYRIQKIYIIEIPIKVNYLSVADDVLERSSLGMSENHFQSAEKYDDKATFPDVWNARNYEIPPKQNSQNI